MEEKTYNLENGILNKYTSSNPYIKEDIITMRQKSKTNGYLTNNKNKNIKRYNPNLNTNQNLNNNANSIKIYKRNTNNSLFNSYNDNFAINNFKKKYGKESYSLMESFSKNHEKYGLNNKYNTSDNLINMKNIGQNVDNHLNNINENYLNKKEFLSYIKPINELDYINIESEDVEFNKNNLILKNNNIYINENKNIYLNELNNSNLIIHQKNTSEQKDINYNKISLRNKNNILSNQKLNTEKKVNNLRYSKKLTENRIPNLSENKDNNLNPKDFISKREKNG